MPSSEHIVQDGSKLTCTACCAKEEIKSHRSATGYVKITSDFIDTHIGCGTPCDECQIRSHEEQLRFCNDCDALLCIDCGQVEDHHCTAAEEEE